MSNTEVQKQPVLDIKIGDEEVTVTLNVDVTITRKDLLATNGKDFMKQFLSQTDRYGTADGGMEIDALISDLKAQEAAKAPERETQEISAEDVGSLDKLVPDAKRG